MTDKPLQVSPDPQAVCRWEPGALWVSEHNLTSRTHVQPCLVGRFQGDGLCAKHLTLIIPFTPHNSQVMGTPLAPFSGEEMKDQRG